MRRTLLILCALAALDVQGDTLADVNAAVRRLGAKQPLKATLTIEQAVKSAGKFANDSTMRVATAEVTHDASGVSITIPQSLVEQASDQSRGAKIGQNDAKDAIGAIRSLDVIEALNFRDSMLSMLNGASITEEKRLAFRGRPARLLMLKLDLKPEKKAGSVQIGSVKTDDRLRLWVGDDNLPIAGERSQKTTAGFMFIKGTFASKTSYTFTHAHDRLLLARIEVVEGGAGMGQKVEKKSVQTLTVRTHIE